MPRSRASLITRPSIVMRCALLVLGAAAVLGLGRSAAAQIAVRTFYQGRIPTVTGEDVEALVETLDLDESQEDLVLAMYQGYRSAFNAAADEAHAELARLREASVQKGEDIGTLNQLIGDYERKRAEWGRQSSAYETSFFADVKDLVTEDQAARWPRFERDRLRRVGVLLGARLMPERVDLVALLDDLDLRDEVRQHCQGVVDQYAIDFDTPLAERLRVADQLDALSYQADAKDNPSRMDSLQQRLIRLHIQLRDLNLLYLDRIAEQLPPEEGRRFRESFQKRVWPRVFGSDPVAADVARVRQLAALTPEQDSAVSGMVGDYHARLEPINRELVEVELTREMQRLNPPTQQGDGRVEQGGAGDPGALEARAQSLLSSRQSLVQSTLASIRTVLRPDQLQALTRGVSFENEGDRRQ